MFTQANRRLYEQSEISNHLIPLKHHCQQVIALFGLSYLATVIQTSVDLIKQTDLEALCACWQLLIVPAV